MSRIMLLLNACIAGTHVETRGGDRRGEDSHRKD